MFTIYALIIIVFLILSLVYLALGRAGIFDFAEEKAEDIKDIFSDNDF